MMATDKRTRKWADITGIFNSSACLLHCAAAPLLLAWVGAATLAWLEWLFVAVAFGAVFYAARRAATPALRWALWAFFSVLVVAVAAEPYWHDAHYLAYAASALLTATHLIGLRTTARRRAARVA